MSKKDRVLLGMSGGVDSSVAAILLQEQGYDVTGITFLFSGNIQSTHHYAEEAKQLAAKLKIKHIVADLRKEFGNVVIRYFKEEYLAGRTPFPCAYCNPQLKFRYLQKYADQNGCVYISTGHYVHVGAYKTKKYLFRGRDPEKDQSFFLWGLRRKVIDRLILPLGQYHKNEIRSIAKAKGFHKISGKKDSLGICFIEGKNYRKFLEDNGIKSRPGNFIYHNGEVIGEHQGITNYTIGQRRGLGINLNFPVFVSEIRPDENEIVLAKFEDLYRNSILIKDYYFADDEIVKNNKQLVVKVRYRLQETPCRLHILDETRAQVELLKSEAMISPGQTAVFYDGPRLVGGGFIESSS